MPFDIDTLALIVSFVALGLSLFQFFRDASRAKIGDTIKAYFELQETVFNPYNETLRELRESHKVDENGRIDIDNKHQSWGKITGWLASIEHFSVGVNTGLYSIRILNRLGGGYYIRLFHELSLIIEKKTVDNISKGKHYDEFQRTVKKLRRMRGNKDSQPQDYSNPRRADAE